MITTPVRSFIKAPWVLIPLSLSFAGNIFMWVYLGWFIRPTEELLILHYTVHFGVDFLGGWQSVFVVPTIGLLFSIINTLVAWWFWSRVHVLSYVVNVVTVVVQGILVAVSILLVALNT